ncbi:hypothetical protein AOG2_03470 [Geobacter sp. AOG2]|nr:hypothetical protein AOG2_03470 [Geobacter sp. AOG2]
MNCRWKRCLEKKCLQDGRISIQLFCKEKLYFALRNNSWGETMGSMKEHPRYHVVSMRISDEEREVLEVFAQQTRRNVSQLMREAMQLLHLKMQTERP